MWSYAKLILLGLVTLLAAIGANLARDPAFMVNALTVMLIGAAMFVRVLRRIDEPVRPANLNEYMDDVVRAGVIATTFWGVIGFLVGVVIAFQLAFPALNFSELTHGYLNFGNQFSSARLIIKIKI